MTDGMHYRVDFVTFCQLLSFGREHRSFFRIHTEDRFDVRDIAYLWRNPHEADGKRNGLKSLYYVMNNLIRSTINPKDGAASDVNGHARNILAKFYSGERFNVPRFMWVELSYAVSDGRRSLPYAPYLMMIIERVTGCLYHKDGFHTVYKIEKSKSAMDRQPGGYTSTHEDIHVPSRAARGSPPPRAGGNKKMSRFSRLAAHMKAILSHCTYASQTAYEDRLENREAIREQREMQGLPPLPPIQPPPSFLTCLGFLP